MSTQKQNLNETLLAIQEAQKASKAREEGLNKQITDLSNQLNSQNKEPDDITEELNLAHQILDTENSLFNSETPAASETQAASE